MPLGYSQRRQNLVYGGKSGFIGYLMIRPPGPWRMYWKTLEGLVLWYDFNQCQVIDLSGHGNNGTIYGAQCVQGRSGKALSFDGVDDYVDCGNDESLNITDEITLAVWVKPSKISDLYAIVSKASNPSPPYNSYEFAIQDNELRIWQGGYGTIISVPYPYTINTWHHIVATIKSNDKVKLYGDGVLLKEEDYPYTFSSASIKDVLIGSWEGREVFDGMIDEVRIYNRALSEEEIKWLYEHT